MKRTFLYMLLTATLGLNASHPVAVQRAAHIVYVPTATQQNAECGYHALQNGRDQLFALQGLEKPPFDVDFWRWLIIQRRHQKYVENLPKYHAALEYMNRYRELENCYTTAIADPETSAEDKLLAQQLLKELRPQKISPIKPREAGTGQWLDDGEMEYLAKAAVYGDLISSQDYTIIPNITSLDGLPREFWPIDPAHWAQVQSKLAVDGGMHIFILGDMAQQGSSTIDGHWIAVVAQNRGGKLTYFVRNSLSGRPQAMVQALINLVDSQGLFA